MRSRCLWLTHERAEAAKVGEIGGGLRSDHRGISGVPVATPRIARHKAQAKPARSVSWSERRHRVRPPTGTSALTIGMWPMAAPRISQHTWYLKAVWSTLVLSGDANAKAQSQLGVPRCVVKASRRNRGGSHPQGGPVTRRAFEAWTANWLQRESWAKLAERPKGRRQIP